jgi:hypothetical protein
VKRSNGDRQWLFNQRKKGKRRCPVGLMANKGMEGGGGLGKRRVRRGGPVDKGKRAHGPHVVVGCLGSAQ